MSITLRNVPKKIKHKRILQYACYSVNKLNMKLASKDELLEDVNDKIKIVLLN